MLQYAEHRGQSGSTRNHQHRRTRPPEKEAAERTPEAHLMSLSGGRAKIITHHARWKKPDEEFGEARFAWRIGHRIRTGDSRSRYLDIDVLARYEVELGRT